MSTNFESFHLLNFDYSALFLQGVYIVEAIVLSEKK